MSNQTTRTNSLPLTLEIGHETAGLLEGIFACTSAKTRTATIDRKDELLSLRHCLFHYHSDLTPFDPKQSFLSAESDIWTTAREIETAVTETGGPTLEWCLALEVRFEDHRVWADITEEWAFELLLQRAISYVTCDFADRAIRSLAAAIQVAANPIGREQQMRENEHRCWDQQIAGDRAVGGLR